MWRPTVRSPPELPPRARRIRWGFYLWLPVMGTTSACAENTWRICSSKAISRNYLRVRGEYFSAPTTCLSCLELPPRARRIPPEGELTTTSLGTTSACAENTTHTHCYNQTFGNYLRVRGEYFCTRRQTFSALELPPRARRIPNRIWRSAIPLGTTSACAENTK